MNERILSVYVKKWIIVFIVNKLNFIYFTWFVYTFVNYKYNVLLKRDDVCLIPLSTLVTPSRFHKGKEIRIVLSKMAKKSNAKCCGNVAAMLWQRLDNVGERRCHNVGNRHRYSSQFRSCHNVVTRSITTLWQRCHNVAVPAGKFFIFLISCLKRCFGNFNYSIWCVMITNSWAR